MHYTPSDSARKEMLAYLGHASTDDLFRDVPAEVRARLDLPPGKSEMEVRREIRGILGKNRPFESYPHFLGGGFYHHHIPAEVKSISFRTEFLTSYTPYQPEVSQGLLQGMFEYQTMVCRLTEMEVANATMYDGATALAEAALMCVRATGRKKLLVPEALHADKRSTLANYGRGAGLRIETVPFSEETGEMDVAALSARLDADTAGVVLENPNLFGVYETAAAEIADAAHAKGAWSVVSVNPISLGLVRGPGAYGADVVVGEGQPLGQSPNLGGPVLGIFATRMEHVRKMPGRVVGETRDAKGDRAYCLTLSTREQHIRRERATSNICTNEAQNAIQAAIYLATLGETGFRRLSELNASRARRAAARLARSPFRLRFPRSHFFNEFTLQGPRPADYVNQILAGRGLYGGIDLAPHVPAMADSMVLAVTEAHDDAAIDRLAAGLGAVA
ncbi:MAG: aminomethyl-transferring glycine dehydrogenase subunit GcvPA [Methanobacteriota archaeon]